MPRKTGIKAYLWDLFKGISILLGLIILFILIIFIIFWISFSHSVDKEEKYKRRGQRIEIEGNGEGSMWLEHRGYLTRTRINSSWEEGLPDSTGINYRQDVYYVHNYDPQDSLFYVRYIDSLTFDRSMIQHDYNFYLYNPEMDKKMPIEFSGESVYYAMTDYLFWNIQYRKHLVNGELIESYICFRVANPRDSKTYYGDFFYFEYDSINNKYTRKEPPEGEVIIQANGHKTKIEYYYIYNRVKR